MGYNSRGEVCLIESMVPGKSPVKAIHPAPVIPAQAPSCERCGCHKKHYEATGCKGQSYKVQWKHIYVRYMVSLTGLTDSEGHASRPVHDGGYSIDGHRIVKFCAVCLKDVWRHWALLHPLQTAWNT